MISNRSLIKILFGAIIFSIALLAIFLMNSFGLIMPYAREVRESNKHIKAVDSHKKAAFLFGIDVEKLLNKSHHHDKDKILKLFHHNAAKVVHNDSLAQDFLSRGRARHQHHHDSQDPSLLSHLLDLDSPAKASSSCPLPVLHPEKFQPIMHWGERKKFPSCRPPNGNISRMERLTSVDGDENGKTVVIVVDTRKCSTHQNSLRVFEFGEMTNADFQRMHSVFDAEQRQNQLKDKYKNVHQFAKAVKASSTKDHRFNEHERVYHLSKPYAVVECGHHDTELHVSAPSQIHDSTKKENKKQNINHEENDSAFKNVLHFMWDSTSTPAFRRGAKKMKKFLQNLNNDPSSPSHVFTFKHIHSVSCCSPGNQVPMYSSNMNGEGDFFVNSEPFPDSTDWIWNIARDELGFKTFWSLDNCPDKSARDYHAYPTVDSRVVAPICLAGVLLSHKERTCLGGKTVDEHVLDGLTDFWKSNPHQKKFAAIQMITPHEETEKQLIEVDDIVSKWFESEEVFTREELENTVIVLWSDHGINFGKYASTHDGEIEKMFPFCFIIAPRKWTPKHVVENLRSFEDRLVTPYDVFMTVRSLMFMKKTTKHQNNDHDQDQDENEIPTFQRDPRNPPLPRPQDSHIMASFQKKSIIPLDLALHNSGGKDRTCDEANIPVEFCSCIAWHKLSPEGISANADFLNYLVKEILIQEHKKLLKDYQDECEDVEFQEIVSVYAQVWPLEYKPPSKDTAKKVWMKPNRDFLKVTYRTKTFLSKDGQGVFVGVVSISNGLFSISSSGELSATSKMKSIIASNSEAKMHAAILDVVRLDRMDAMRKKCGIVQKVPEQLCICK